MIYFLTTIVCIAVIHDIDIGDDIDRSMSVTSCGQINSSLAEVDSGNSSSHSPSPGDTYHTINRQTCQSCQRPEPLSSKKQSCCKDQHEYSLREGPASVESKILLSIIEVFVCVTIKSVLLKGYLHNIL